MLQGRSRLTSVHHARMRVQLLDERTEGRQCSQHHNAEGTAAGRQGPRAAAVAVMGRPPAPSQLAEPLGLHQAATPASGGSNDVAERVLQVRSSGGGGASGGQTLAAFGSRESQPRPASPCRLSSWHADCALQEGLPHVPKYLKVCDGMLRMPSCWVVAALTLPHRPSHCRRGCLLGDI